MLFICYFVQVPQQYKSPVAASKPDPYYGYEKTTHLYTQFIMHYLHVTSALQPDNIYCGPGGVS